MTEQAATALSDTMDRNALSGWLSRHVEGFQSPIDIDRFPGGQSNPTYKLTTPDRSYVMRTRPLGPLIEGAHAIDREYRVIRALNATDVPVPREIGRAHVELQSLMRISYAVFCLKKKQNITNT